MGKTSMIHLSMDMTYPLQNWCLLQFSWKCDGYESKYCSLLIVLTKIASTKVLIFVLALAVALAIASDQVTGWHAASQTIEMTVWHISVVGCVWEDEVLGSGHRTQLACPAQEMGNQVKQLNTSHHCGVFPNCLYDHWAGLRLDRSTFYWIENVNNQPVSSL